MKSIILVAILLLSVGFSQGLEEGDTAFLPTLPNSYGRPVALADAASEGGWVALWFYPRAFTGGCSLQAKRYSDLHEDFTRASISAYGVSADSAQTQCDFVEELAQNGAMIPDPRRVLADAYGVDGGAFFNRNTVLINPAGRVEKIWRNTDPIDDADRVLEYVLKHASN